MVSVYGSAEAGETSPASADSDIPDSATECILLVRTPIAGRSILDSSENPQLSSIPTPFIRITMACFIRIFVMTLYCIPDTGALTPRGSTIQRTFYTDGWDYQTYLPRFNKTLTILVAGLIIP